MQRIAPRALPLVGALLVSALPSSAAAQDPVLTVRGRAALEIDPVRRTPDGVAIAGAAVDRNTREPLAGEEVEVQIGAATAAARTGADGRFEVALPAEAGERDLRVSFPGTELYAPAELEVVVGAPQPVPLAYTLAAFGAAGFLALALSAGRALPARLVARRRPRAGRSPPPRPRRERPDGGVVTARPARRFALRRSVEREVSGRAIDATTGAPIPGARVEASGAERLAVQADERGRFAIELAPGTWRLEVAASGYVREHVSASSPHRGELRGVTVELVPVRERIFARYREAAEPLLPSPDLWGIWTPRQIVDHVRAERAAPALAALTARVEEAYFSARVPEEREVHEVEALVAAARDGITSA